MRHFQRTLASIATAIALSATGNATAQFNNLYFFGDSLTDAGVYGGARFTVNPGLVWAQDLGNMYGMSITPSTTGGTDYAQGGQRVVLPGNVVPGFPQRPISVQIDELLKATPTLNPNALYSMWIGANDVRAQLLAIGAGQIPAAQGGANVILAATQNVEQLARLRAAGAQYIAVANLPDLGRTPEAQAGGPAVIAGASQLANTYNTTLNAGLDKLPFQTIRVNIYALLNEILASPSTYGFANTTGVACTTSSALNCTTSTLVSPTAAATYLFADSIHPTPPAHLVIAQLVESMIDGPQQMAALAEAPVAVEQANYRALDGRMWSSLNAPRTQGKLEGWAVYDYGHTDMQAGPGNGSAFMNTIAVGGDMKVSDHALVGLMFGFSENKGDFGGAGGGYTMRQPVGTIYAGYGDGPWYVGATVGAGSQDYSDINRAIPLGTGIRTENSQARGYEYTGRLLGGYWFAMKDLLHGPYARLDYTKAVVRPFSETSTDSTALNYGRQEAEQLLWSAGWQVAGSFGAIRPYARVTWEYDSKDQNRSVSASSGMLGGNYSVPVGNLDNSYALFNVGASTEFGGVTGFLTGSGTAGRGDGNYWAITVGIRTPL